GMRTRRGTVLRPPPDPAEEEDGGEEAPGAPEMVEEEEDFQEAQFRSVMAALESGEEAGDSEEEEEEEVLGLQLPEEDSEEEDGEEEEEEEQGDGDLSMESDLEERHQDTKLPHELSWGQRKQLYYDTDYGSDAQAKGKRRQQEVDAEEEEEEQEAQIIQKRLVQDLGEDDYGLDMIQGYLAEQQKTDSKGQKIDKDLQALPKKEQLKLLKQESPELLQLIEDFEVKLMELKDELHPLLQMVRNGTIPQGKGSRYLQTKYHLYLNYCANISFYLVLKSKRMPVHSHPVIERLVAYRNIINDLAVIDQKLSPQVRALLKNYYDKKEDKLRKEKKFAVFLPLDVKKNRSKRAAVLPNGRAAAAAAAETSDESDLDEEAALEYYNKMEEKLKLKRKRTKEQEALEEEEEAALEGEDPNKKRGVTYQMIKNKGLTPRRKKIDRNPRVKHREKFRRAKIRRKGQVREVRRELHRYSGEHSGIRAGVKKSRKLQ
ncbi:SAS10 protein, partial [Nycticryphes semicollaris]|nr:SAS10 protein [Nycticryphes semicollaris]